MAANRSEQSQTGPVPSAFGDLIAEATRRYNLPSGLLPSVIKAESGFNPRAVSPAGAKGLMQLMDGTARTLGVRDSFDPAQNIDGGARFLRQLLDRYGGDVRRALAAYNAGPGAVDRYGGIPPYPETQTYVSRILGYMTRT
ncbi:MAG: lytic transglycosylase domain-containing protein [Chloroflexota bacterium]|nr:MAG: lytic transglycosylase domain-containing protein [Chloroflexota bacterium]